MKTHSRFVLVWRWCRNFRAGIKFGRGVYTIPDFGVYEGTFEQGQLNGEGTLKLESGDSYRG